MFSVRKGVKGARILTMVSTTPNKVSRDPAVSNPTYTLLSPPDHPDIPVNQTVNELDQPGDDGVEPVPGHLLGHEGQERLGEGDNPPVLDIVRPPIALLCPDELSSCSNC